MNRTVTERIEPEQEVGASDAACELCGRSQMPLTRHHLIPQSRHNKGRTQRLYEKEEMLFRIALLCRPCHSQVHAVLDNASLVLKYNTVEALASHSDIAKFAAWIATKPAGLKVTVRHKK
jgi:5-methylcytosine-specific restriction endonuclease McrA